MWILYYFNALLMTIGLWKLFPKCGINRKWALVPFARLYKITQAADVEDLGIAWVIAVFLSNVVSQFYMFYKDSVTETWFALAIAGVVLVLIFATLIYEIRIYIAFCKLFGKKKLWVVLFVIASSVPFLIWGFSDSVSEIQTEASDDAEAARISGLEVSAGKSALVVNLKERTVRDFLRKKTLLRDIHFSLQPGHMVLLLGGSGSGKTTLINAVIGYEPADATIVLNGQNVYEEYEEMLYRIALVPQQDLIRYDDTVVRTLTDAAFLRLPENVSRREIRKRVNEVLEIFGLSSVRDSEVQKLSGGQRKRLSIAMEFISNPYLFVLDEPDSGLDGVLARDLMTRLRAISREGKIVIVITHSPDRVADLFDDVIVLAKDAKNTGRLVYFGSIDDAQGFFGTDSMEKIVKMINRTNEGGDGRADELIEKFAEVSNAKE